MAHLMRLLGRFSDVQRLAMALAVPLVLSVAEYLLAR